MSALNDEWVVQRHGAIQVVTDGILTVQGTIRMPLGQFPRRMTVVALQNAQTAIWSAMPLGPREMDQIEALGKPSYLIVPNAHHRLDVRAWKKRYPEALVLAPDGARRSVAEACQVDSNESALNDARSELVVAAGTGGAEFALRVMRDDGLTLVVNDLIANVVHPPGLMANIMVRVMRFGLRQPETPRIVKRTLVKDPDALSRQFEEWSQEPNLRRIIPSHGEIISNPKRVLARLAEV